MIGLYGCAIDDQNSRLTDQPLEVLRRKGTLTDRLSLEQLQAASKPNQTLAQSKLSLRITGRLLGPDMRPRSNKIVMLALERLKPSQTNSTQVECDMSFKADAGGGMPAAQTDGDGRFSFEVKHSWFGEGGWGILTNGLRAERLVSGGRQVVLILPDQNLTELDLGDLHEPLP